MAVALACDGFDVGVTWHRDEDGAQETAREVEGAGRRSEVCRLDLTDLPDCADVIDELADTLGGIDVLVNNSGTSRRAPFVELSWDDWRETLAVDLDGAFLCAQRAARRMIAQGRGGRIVNVTSVHEHVPLGRPGDAREVASLIVWLASPGAAYATGHSFVIDGGLLLMPAGERKTRPAAPATVSRAR